MSKKKKLEEIRTQVVVHMCKLYYLQLLFQGIIILKLFGVL